jgi:phage-related protein
VDAIKPLRFVGNSRDDIREFPAQVRRVLGEELRRVQQGLMPTDFKPMPSVGKGAYEIRIQLEGAWRAIYVAKFGDAIYVLHAFRKKTRQTSKEDIDLAVKRYKIIGEKP